MPRVAGQHYQASSPSDGKPNHANPYIPDFYSCPYSIRHRLHARTAL